MSEQRIVVETLCPHNAEGSEVCWERRIVELPDLEKLREAVAFMEAGVGLHPGGHIERVCAAARWVLSLESE